jgi:hypothetical protein
MPESNPLTHVTPAPAPAADAGLSSADVDRLVTALDSSHKTVQKTVGDWSQSIIKAIGQPTAPRAPAPAADDDALTAIAADGWKPLDNRVERAVQKVLQDTLAPYMGAQANDQAAANETAARTAVDTEFGTGTYDSEFKSRVDELFDGQTASRSVRSQFDRALALVKGEKFGTLADRRSKVATDRDTAAKEAEKMARAPFMPGGGYRSANGDAALSDEDREQLRVVRNATGRAPSEEEAAKLRDLVMRSPRGVRLDDFNEVFPLSKS